MIVAVDGVGFHDTVDALVDLLSSDDDEDAKWLLTIFRSGKFFEEGDHRGTDFVTSKWF